MVVRKKEEGSRSDEELLRAIQDLDKKMRPAPYFEKYVIQWPGRRLVPW